MIIANGDDGNSLEEEEEQLALIMDISFQVDLFNSIVTQFAKAPVRHTGTFHGVHH